MADLSIKQTKDDYFEIFKLRKTTANRSTLLTNIFYLILLNQT